MIIAKPITATIKHGNKPAKLIPAAFMISTLGTLREPIIIETREISTSWWGKAWCDHIDYYADFDNRLPRGRTYVRKGAVIDLKIEEGVINALVKGSRPTPYKVNISLIFSSIVSCATNL